MRYVDLADGRTYPAPLCGASGGMLVIHLDAGADGLAALAAAFSEPAATRQITFRYGDMADTHAGYTRLRALALDDFPGASAVVTLEKERSGEA